MNKWMSIALSVTALAACGGPALEPPGSTASDPSPTPDGDATDLVEDPLTRELAFQIPGRDLRVRPPLVQSMELVADAAAEPGGARLEARYAEPLPSRIKLLLGGKLDLLRDDGQAPDRVAGDGVYSMLVPADFEPSTSALTPAAAIDVHKSLLVTNTAVVNDSARTQDPCTSGSAGVGDKEWTFGYLLTHMANTSISGTTFNSAQLTKASKFATAWLKSMSSDAVVNGDNVHQFARTHERKVAEETLRQWRCKSGVNSCCAVFEVDAEPAFDTSKQPFQDCERDAANTPLAMNKAPFRLLGIVNRLDRRHNAFFGEGLAGELRFVFSLLDLESREGGSGSVCAGRGIIDTPRSVSTKFNAAQPGFSTVILEYAVDRSSSAVKTYAQQWANLSTRSSFDSTFRTNLQTITDSVVRAGKGAAKGRANGSELIRLRTNFTVDNVDWQFQEFEIDKTTGLPFPTTTKQTPSKAYFDGPTLLTDPQGYNANVLGDWINANEAAILTESHVVPRIYWWAPPGSTNTVPFFLLGGSAENQRGAFWKGGGIVRNPEARHKFSLNTCNGCHGAEGQSLGVFHVEPRNSGQESVLSDFLTGASGLPVPDPMDPDNLPGHFFHQLADRAVDLNAALAGSALTALAFQPSGRTH